MGSVAVDRQGNMAVGYSTSNATAPNYPSLAYSGRLAGDPANQLPQTERQLAAGVGSQNICGSAGMCSRWGDYSAMTIDPVDDCTFWYTNEYYSTTPHATAGSWDTYIGAFRFPGCTGPAAKLVFTVEPNSAYGVNGTITVSVSVEDAAGNVVTSDGSSVTLALQGGTAGATLGGTTTVPATNGVATFAVSVDTLGAGYTLHATDAALTPDDSSAFSITAGPPATISFSAGPASAVAGAANNAPTGIVVHVQDSGSNPVVGDTVNLAVASGPGTLTVTNGQTTDVNGNATFSDAVLTTAGTYTLSATESTSSLSTTSGSFVISPAAAQLVFTTQPTDVVRGSALNTIAVSKQDTYGNLYSSDTDQVDFTVGSCGGYAMGSVNLSGGTATLNGAQRFYTVTTGLQVAAKDNVASLSVQSNAFAVTALADFLFADGYETCRP
jgi:hypothetical protein